MARREKKVFFAWEKRSGMLGIFGLGLGRARIRQMLIGASVLSVTALLFARESDGAKVRATRTAIGVAFEGVEAYRADHKGSCPKDLADLKPQYLKDVPVDAWGHSLHLICPGRRDPKGFDLVSDGPENDGFSRVE